MIRFPRAAAMGETGGDDLILPALPTSRAYRGAQAQQHRAPGTL